jgi:hypothetical protein
MLIVYDYTRLTWVFFLKEKSEAFDKFKIYKALVENETYLKIKFLRLENGGEFIQFCENQGMKRKFSSPKTPQHNGVVERKNIIVQEATRTMLNEAKLPDKFWRDSIYTTIHILNRARLRPNHDKNPYELWFGRATSVKHFRTFGSKFYIKNDEDNLGKFDPRSDEGIFLGYSYNKKAYICYNLILLNIVESSNVKIDDLKQSISQGIDKKSQQEDDDIKSQPEDDYVESQQEDYNEETQEIEPHTDEEDNEETPLPRAPSKRVQKNHPESFDYWR